MISESQCFFLQVLILKLSIFNKKDKEKNYNGKMKNNIILIHTSF